MPLLKYNERSWAIDVITEINIYCAARPAFNIHAKGELGLKSSKTTLFPDVLLFGINAVTQGWELKMPDTDINDIELLKNAEKKANMLRLNSFLVWNGKDAALFYKNEESEKFSCIKNWSRAELTNRAELERLRGVWVSMLHEILIDLEVFLKNGILRPQAGTDVLDETFITRVIDSVFKSDSASIQARALKNETLRREITSWRLTFGISAEDQFNELARLNILCWVNRFIFCHYLSRYNSIATEIQSIDSDWSIENVYELFHSISSKMDFANVFVPGIADNVISDDGWMARIAFNRLLTEIRIADIPESSLRRVLDTFSLTSQRKSFGQYSTPPLLAQAIAFIALNDLTKDAWDPCCGSGSIAKALYQTKVEEGMDRQDALESVWASDKFQMPLQLTSINLSDPLAIESVIQVFQSDVLDISTNQEILLTNPKDPNTAIQKKLPKMSAIASNLPFVSFNDLYVSTTNLTQFPIDEQTVKLAEMKRADLYAIITLALESHLSDHGRMVLIVSNSWIATDWGMKWQDLICERFRLISVIKSGNGRWFQNSDVQSTILVLEKRNNGEDVDPNEQINFVTTNSELPNWTEEYIAHLKEAVLEGVNHPFLNVATHSLHTINVRRSAGYSWRANFHCGIWLEKVIPKAIPASSYLEIARGSRGGQDKFFILSAEQTNGIEIDFLIPMLKTSSGQKELIAKPCHYAFCCDRSLNDLKAGGFDGAISWIESFSERRNSKGKPLKEVLKIKPGLDWYQIEPNETGDFAISMNPDASLVVFRTLEKSFMNQRLIRMSTIHGDPALLHALLNCCVTMLNIEFLGFGRALGALDLSSNRLKNHLHLLDPKVLDQSQIDSIKESFSPLLNRPFENLIDELQLSDRQVFDRTVLSCWGLETIQFEIYEALIEAVQERRNVNQLP